MSANSLLRKIEKFILEDIWRIPSRELTRGNSFLIRVLRILVYSVKQFQKDDCFLRSSALTFFTLLSIVPVFAMAFGIAKGFGMEKTLQNLLLQKAEGQEEIFLRIIEFSNSLLENTKGGIVAGVGIILLFGSIIKMMGHIENAFNKIWDIKVSRTLGRKFTDYLSFILIIPVLIIISSSLTVLLTSSIIQFSEKISFLGFLGPGIIFFAKFFSYFLLWTLFSFIYIYMPNTKVNLLNGVIAGVVAGTIYQLVQFNYIYFQIKVASYNAIYGSFAALPLFLIWLQLSWLVLLFGAEIAFSCQNVDNVEFESDCDNASHAFKRLAALRIVHLCAKRFQESKIPLTDTKIADEVNLPIKIVRHLLFELTESRLLSEVKVSDDEKSSAYQPAFSLDELTIHRILTGLEHHGIETLPILQSPEVENLKKRLQAFEEQMSSSALNVPIVKI